MSSDQTDQMKHKILKFKEALREGDAQAVIDKWLLGRDAVHVSGENIENVRNLLVQKFNVPVDGLQVLITGSAKLGFSISEKRSFEKPTLPRYRLFAHSSDIDVAVVSAELFEQIWLELTLFSHNQPRFPWTAGRLGDYLVCGWLRPDHFPKQSRLYHCDLWWDVFRQLSADPRYERRKVRGGLFHSAEQLKTYMARAVNECILLEQITTK